MTALLVALTALISLVGTAATPTYASLSPWRSDAVADLRGAPTADGWSTDLAARLLPLVAPGCAAFHASSAVDHVVLLWATTTGHGCTPATADTVTSTVALFDTATGDVLWTHRLSTDAFRDIGTVAVSSASVVRASRTVLVEASAAGRFRVVSLDLATGSLKGFHDLGTTDQGVQSTVTASFALLGATGATAGTTRWQLVDPARVGRPVWFATLDDTARPLLVGDAVFVALGGRSVRVDGRTGRITTLGQGTVDLQSAVVEGNDLYTTQASDAGDVITAWNGEGRMLWVRSGTGDIVGVTRTCVVTSFVGTATSSCLSRATGHVLWGAGTGTSSVSLGLPGQTSDSVFVVSVAASGRQLLVLDGATGAVEAAASIPVLTFPVLASHSTGYLVRRDAADADESISAFDVRTGRVLWTEGASRGRSVELWGGRLVSVSSAGVARELVDRQPGPLGR